MSITVDTSQAPQKLAFVLSEEWPTIAEHTRLRRQLIASGYLTAATRALFDVRSTTKLPHLSDLDSLVQLALETPWPLSRAYLTKTTVQYGVMRQFQALTNECLNVQIFTDEADAQKWYQSPASGR